MEAGLAGRPLWSELVKVTSGELIFRRVRPADIKDHMPLGARVQTSAMPTNEFTPNPKSYGPSVFVKALLANGVEDLREAYPRWSGDRFVELQVGELATIGIDVRLSPQDCDIQSIRHAHATLLNVTKVVRARLLRLIDFKLS